MQTLFEQEYQAFALGQETAIANLLCDYTKLRLNPFPLGSTDRELWYRGYGAELDDYLELKGR